MRTKSRPFQHTPAVVLSSFCLCSLVGCASIPRVGSPQNALGKAEIPADRINWPEQYEPEDASFFVHNQIDINAPPEAVWEVIIQAETWPSWYEGAENVKVTNGANGALGPRSSFTWSTMGLDFTSTITEFQAPYRLSWESRKSTIQGYHAWLLTPSGAGCRLITEESQHGFMTLMQKIFVPNKLHRLHDSWLSQIKKKAESRTSQQPLQPGGGN